MTLPWVDFRVADDSRLLAYKKGFGKPAKRAGK
jgi:hypothetical protein